MTTGKKAVTKKMEEALLVSEEKFSKAFYSNPEPMAISTLSEGRYIEINDIFLRIWGYQRDEVVGRTGIELGFWPHPDDRNEMARLLRKDGVIRDLEVSFRSKSGELRFGLLSADLIEISGEICLIHTIRDMTERKKMEEALLVSEEKFSKAFYSNPEPMAISTLSEGRYIEINDIFLRIWGYQRDEVVGRTGIELGFWPHPDDRNEMARLLRKDGVIRDLEVSFRSKSGELRFGLLSADLIEISGEICLIHTIRDMTERKKMEEALQESEEFSSKLLSNSPNPIIVINEDTSVRYINPALERITGFSSAKVIGSRAPYPWWPEETRDKRLDSLRHDLLKGNRAVERLFRGRNGRRLLVETTSIPIKRYGRYRYSLETWTDITERERLKENLQLYVTEITKAQEEERKRIARELHDDTVQSLLTLGINIETIIRTEKRMPLSLIEKLRNIQRTTRSIADGVRRFSHNLRPDLLDELGISVALELLAKESELTGGPHTTVKKIGYELRLPSEQELLLFRIAQEALNNVKKHSQATEASIEVCFARKKVRLCVNDNGIGFDPPQELSNLARKGKLGLVSVSERVRLLDGSLRIDSHKGKGTTVVVDFPA
ncbi:MAG: PAS domain S-box protein [Dehalococcoidales bacterium]|nr:PAS domain S-box protein [Dehalococcoidales bacterium]